MSSYIKMFEFFLKVEKSQQFYEGVGNVIRVVLF